MLRTALVVLVFAFGGCVDTPPVNPHVPGPGYGYPHAYPGYFFDHGFIGHREFSGREEHEEHEGHER